MRLNLLFLLVLFFMTDIFPQQKYPFPPEVWSEPERVDSLAVYNVPEDNPVLTQDMKTMYLYRAGVEISIKIDSLWTIPNNSVTKNINKFIPLRNPSLSRDGKRLYFTCYAGNWDVFRSDWDSVQGVWGLPYNMQAPINTEGLEWYAFEHSEDSLFVVNREWDIDYPWLFARNRITNQWAMRDSFRFNRIAPGDLTGMWVSPDCRKVYFSWWNIHPNNDSSSTDLGVTYRDTINNKWGKIYRLNINSFAYRPDSTRLDFWQGGMDDHPWLSPDGKILYFDSNRRAKITGEIAPDIFRSYMLIDEHGNPVSVKRESPGVKNYDIELVNYPNPFNGSTKINFTISKGSYIDMIIYDLSGREITKIIQKKYFKEGKYEEVLELNKNNRNLSSGVYLCLLITDYGFKVNKLLYIK